MDVEAEIKKLKQAVGDLQNAVKIIRRQMEAYERRANEIASQNTGLQGRVQAMLNKADQMMHNLQVVEKRLGG